MANLTTAERRIRIEVADAEEIARRAGARDPDLVAREELEDRLGASPLILDGLRRRPRYFDGRFLTGADLTRDQDYVRQRQNDLAMATGTGVVAGLEVSDGDDPRGQTLVIAPGHGVTADGQLVMIETRREIPILDIPESRRLNATLGLRGRPAAPLGRRTGLFIVALRPVEFTANPIAAYPTQIAGPRHVEDGDIIEATAITLIPYPGGDVGALEDARRLTAKEIFLGQPRGVEEDALPLAMIALDRGALAWIDQAMVRRETGADTPLQVALGARPRAVSEAFIRQYHGHLADLLARRRAAGLPLGFAAAQGFAALPPAGPLPAAAIVDDADGFRQLWFPPAVDVELSFAPADEIAALVEESQALPPIDLADRADVLDATSVVVLAPVDRPRLQRFAFALERLQIAVEGGVAAAAGRTTPAADLAALLARKRALAAPAAISVRTEAEAAALAAWRAAWAEAMAALPDSGLGAPALWYVRRRTVPQHSAVVGVSVPIAGDDDRDDETVRGRLDEIGLRDRVEALTARATPAAGAAIVRFLATPRIEASDVLLTAGVRALELESEGAPRTDAVVMIAEESVRDRIFGEALPGVGGRDAIRRIGRPIREDRAAALREGGRLTEADVAEVVSDFARPTLGDGLKAADKVRGARLTRAPAVWLGDTGRALAVDAAALRLVADIRRRARLEDFVERLDAIIAAEAAAKLDDLLTEAIR